MRGKIGLTGGKRVEREMKKKTLESSDHFLSEEPAIWIPVIPRSSVDLSQDPSTFSSTEEKGTEKPGSSQRDQVSHYKLITG